MKNHIQDGNVVTHTVTADVSSGDGVLLSDGGLFGIASTDALAGADVEVVLHGVFELPAVSTGAIAKWAPAYWDNGSSRLTGAATGNTLVGSFASAKADGVTLAEVLLVQSVG